MRNDNTPRCPHDHPVKILPAVESHGPGWVQEFPGPDCNVCPKDIPLRAYKPGTSPAAVEARDSGPAELDPVRKLEELRAGPADGLPRFLETDAIALLAEHASKMATANARSLMGLAARLTELENHGARESSIQNLMKRLAELEARVKALEADAAGHPHLKANRDDLDETEEEKTRQWMDAATETRKPVINYLSVAARAVELADKRTTYTFVSNATRCVFCKATILKHEAELAMPFGWRHASCRVEVRNRRRVVVETGYKDAPGRGTCARLALLDSLSRGEAPIASHLLYPIVLGEDHPPHRRTGIEAGLSWLSVADAVVVYTDAGITDGVAFAIALAEALQVPVEYRKLEGSGIQDPT